MAPYAVSVTMAHPFRGASELFSNVFHYDADLVAVTNDGVIDAVVAGLKAAYPSSVGFRQARLYGPTNQGQLANVTRLIKDLTGNGTATMTGGSFYPELAFFVSMYVGRNPATGRKRFLRKWLHTGKMPSATGNIIGDQLISTAERTFFEDWFESMKNITVQGQSLPICTPQGDHLPLNAQAVCGDRLHIRQLNQ